MNTKTTKIALLTSLMALILCVAMFVGSTFAWFTDSAEVSKNTIEAGNLDVELEYYDGVEWKSLEADSDLFNDSALWEPGHTEVVYLRVVNAGELAFDYKFSTNIYEEVSAKNVAGKDFKLSDYIVMGVDNVADVANPYATRAAARAAVKDNAKPIKDSYVGEGTLYPKNNIPADIVGASYEECVALVVYMPEEVGNEANYRGTAPSVTLGLNVYATQETYEEDGFDSDYDENAGAATPSVPVSEQEIEVTVYDVFDANKAQETITTKVDIYEFVAENFTDSYPLETYKDWTCDFFVSTNGAVNEGMFLVGNYADYGWLGFWVPKNDEAYEPIGLLGVVTTGGESNWTYQAIHDEVQVFRCGIVDYDGNNDGLGVTVELRMTSPDKAKTVTVASIDVVMPESPAVTE